MSDRNFEVIHLRIQIKQTQKKIIQLNKGH